MPSAGLERTHPEAGEPATPTPPDVLTAPEPPVTPDPAAETQPPAPQAGRAHGWRRWTPALAGLISGAWALACWLTLFPSADKLAEGIQVQSLLADPRLVLSYPGQAHGGVLEYPFLLALAWLDPGNYYLIDLPRVLYAAATGAAFASLVLRLFPALRRGVFLAAVAAGPAWLVSAMWLNALYALSWLLVVLGCWVFVPAGRPGPAPRPWRCALAGLLVGLGVYEHPSAVALAFALALLIWVKRRPAWRSLASVAGGFALGCVPLVLARLFPPATIVYSPVGSPRVEPSQVRDILGLTLDASSWPRAVLPNTIGLNAGPPIISQRLTFAVMATAIVLAVAAGGVGVARARLGRPIGDGPLLAGCWAAGTLTVLALATVVPPVWFYGTCLSFLVWLTLALPRRGTTPRPARYLTPLVVAGLALLTVVAWWPQLRRGTDPVRDKAQSADSFRQVAHGLHEAGAGFLFGDYWTVIPFGYASGGTIHPVANHFNRFPVDADLPPASPVVVAVDLAPTTAWGRQAVDQVRAACTEVEGRTVGTFGVFSCPISLLQSAR